MPKKKAKEVVSEEVKAPKVKSSEKGIVFSKKLSQAEMNEKGLAFLGEEKGEFKYQPKV